MRCRNVRHGWVMIEMVFGLMLIGLMGVALSVGISREPVILQKMSCARAAVRLAESALLDLQMHQASVSPNASVSPLAAEAPAGMRWVQVQTNAEGRQATLIGLAPMDAMEKKP